MERGELQAQPVCARLHEEGVAALGLELAL